MNSLKWEVLLLGESYFKQCSDLNETFASEALQVLYGLNANCYCCVCTSLVAFQCYFDDKLRSMKLFYHYLSIHDEW